MAIDLKDYITDQYNNNSSLNPGNLINKDGINNQKVVNPNSLYYHIIVVGLRVAMIIAVLAIIYGGILYVTAAGDPEKTEAGKRTLIGAIIGLVIIMLSYAIYNYLIAAVSV